MRMDGHSTRGNQCKMRQSRVDWNSEFQCPIQIRLNWSSHVRRILQTLCLLSLNSSSKVSVRQNHIDSYKLLAAHAVGVSSGSLWMDELASPGRTAARYLRTGILSRRQVSTMERIAATRGPAFSCPMWVQLRRPIATGRMEFSARLLLSSSSG